MVCSRFEPYPFEQVVETVPSIPMVVFCDIISGFLDLLEIL